MRGGAAAHTTESSSNGIDPAALACDDHSGPMPTELEARDARRA